MRFPKKIMATADEGNLCIKELKSEGDEAEYIISKINELSVDGTSFDEISILYRNHSDARYIVDKLLESKIPFYLKEKMPNIYSHFIISDLEAYFQIASCTEEV